MIVRTISTPWTPYAVMFSPKGDRLAIGGGTWYGGGGLLIAPLAGEPQRLDVEPVVRKALSEHVTFTASSVCFSADGQLLVVAGWSGSQHYAGTLLFNVNGTRVTYERFLVQQFHRQLGGPTPTGVALVGGRVIVRNNTPDVRDVVTSWSVPEAAAWDPVALRNTHTRLLVHRNTVLTGWRRRGRGPIGEGQLKANEANAALLQTTLQGEPMGFIDTPMKRVTAIGTDGRGILLGGLNGEVVRITDDLAIERVLCATQDKPRPPGNGLAWAAHKPASVVGICSLAEERWVSLDASGELKVWQGDDCVDSISASTFGTPRALAAHPREPLVAVGVKHGGFGTPESAVVLLRV